MRNDTTMALMLAQMTIIESLDKEAANHVAHIIADHAKMDEMQFTISDLRRQLEENGNYYAESKRAIQEENKRLRDQVHTMRAKVEGYDTLQANYDKVCDELSAIRQEHTRTKLGLTGLDTNEQVANTYMRNRGLETWANDKIGTIKVVREVTGWDLKTAKDFCENYIRSAAATVEDNGPQTQRSLRGPEVKEKLVQVATA